VIAAFKELTDMDLRDIMRTAGSTREFRTDPVADDTLYRVLDNTRFAPSGGNRQGWRVIVVKDPRLRSGLRDLYLSSWRENMQALFAHLPDNGSLRGPLCRTSRRAAGATGRPG
jgi:nitroreductase